MSNITADSLTVDETVPVRSRTFSPEVVAKVKALLDGTDPTHEGPVKNVAIGKFDKEGAARSALTTLNKLLKEAGSTKSYSGTVRPTDDGKYKGILLNKEAKQIDPAKLEERKAKAARTRAAKKAAATRAATAASAS